MHLRKQQRKIIWKGLTIVIVCLVLIFLCPYIIVVTYDIVVEVDLSIYYTRKGKNLIIGIF